MEVSRAVSPWYYLSGLDPCVLALRWWWEGMFARWASRLWNTPVWIPATLGKTLFFSESQISSLENVENNNTFHVGMIWEVCEVRCWKHVAERVTPNSHSVCVSCCRHASKFQIGSGRGGGDAAVRWGHGMMAAWLISGKLIHVTVHVKIHGFPLFNCLPLPYLFCSFYENPFHHTSCRPLPSVGIEVSC